VTIARVLAVLVLSILLCACAQPHNTSLKVATFNILHGGRNDGGPLLRTAEVIRASGADVVGIQESDGSAGELARLLGWNYREFSFDRGTETGNTDAAILTRFPITQTFRSGIRVEIAPRQEAFVFNVHTRAYPYQPYDIRDGTISNESQAIAAAKAARGEEIGDVLAEVAPLLAKGRAVFLTGDFNEPSHLDWTPAAAKARLHTFAVAWPTSAAVLAAGLRDSYRQLHPDEVADPGLTWTSRPQANEVHDRIDFVYFAGAGVKATDSKLLGEGDLAPYPSDHRAVVSTFQIPPAALAPLRKGINLTSNSGAEANAGAADGADRILTEWESPHQNTPATAQLLNKHGYAPVHPGGGINCFYGGVLSSPAPESHSITQTIDLAGVVGKRLGFELSGRFGGYVDQNDTASLTADFLDAIGNTLQSATIGNVTAVDRQNETQLLPRSTSGMVPPLSHQVRLTLSFRKVADGTHNYAAADNLSLVICDIAK
jgi:endonuclease/exonuclease/phosphatase family metal-dependent hydrolase